MGQWADGPKFLWVLSPVLGFNFRSASPRWNYERSRDGRLSVLKNRKARLPVKQPRFLSNIVRRISIICGANLSIRCPILNCHVFGVRVRGFGSTNFCFPCFAFVLRVEAVRWPIFLSDPVGYSLWVKMNVREVLDIAHRASNHCVALQALALLVR